MEVHINGKKRQGVDEAVQSRNELDRDKFVIIGGVRDDTFTGLSENQVGPTRMTQNRGMHVNLRDASGNELGILTNPFPVGGNIAHDAVDSGNPIKIGHRAVDVGVTPTAVAAGDRTDGLSMRGGVPFAITGFPDPSFTVSNFTAAQTDTSIGPAVGASQKFVLTGLGIYCGNANGADLNVNFHLLPH